MRSSTRTAPERIDWGLLDRNERIDASIMLDILANPMFRRGRDLAKEFIGISETGYITSRWRSGPDLPGAKVKRHNRRLAHRFAYFRGLPRSALRRRLGTLRQRTH